MVISALEFMGCNHDLHTLFVSVWVGADARELAEVSCHTREDHKDDGERKPVRKREEPNEKDCDERRGGRRRRQGCRIRDGGWPDDKSGREEGQDSDRRERE